MTKRTVLLVVRYDCYAGFNIGVDLVLHAERNLMHEP